MSSKPKPCLTCRISKSCAHGVPGIPCVRRRWINVSTRPTADHLRLVCALSRTSPKPTIQSPWTWPPNSEVYSCNHEVFHPQLLLAMSLCVVCGCCNAADNTGKGPHLRCKPSLSASHKQTSLLTTTATLSPKRIRDKHLYSNRSSMHLFQSRLPEECNTMCER